MGRRNLFLLGPERLSLVWSTQIPLAFAFPVFPFPHGLLLHLRLWLRLRLLVRLLWWDGWKTTDVHLIQDL
jgi:hypothetical protein